MSLFSLDATRHPMMTRMEKEVVICTFKANLMRKEIQRSRVDGKPEWKWKSM